MLKRMFCLLLALAFTLCAVPALAEDTEAPAARFDYSKLTTPRYIVIDAGDTGASQPIAEKGADEQLYPASTTKILTAIVALENGDPDMEITVGDEILGLYELKRGYTAQSSLMGLVQGETVTLNDLLHGLMLISGNEAADAIAVAIGGSIEGFVKMMNDKAAELGMKNSHFMNPNGVNHEKHYSTARDMAKLTAYAIQNPKFAALWSTKNYIAPANSVRSTDIVMVNTNFLLTSEGHPEYDEYVYPYCTGGKTGLTTKAGSCLVTAAEKDGASTIVCLYGDGIDGKEKYERFSNAKAIFEDCFNYVYQNLNGEDLNLQREFTCEVANGLEDDLENGTITLTADIGGFSVRALPQEVEALKAPGAIKAEIEWEESELSAPIHQGQLLGTVHYTHNGKEVYKTNLIAPHDVKEIALVGANVMTADGSAGGEEGSVGGLLVTPAPTATAETKKSGGGLGFVMKLVIVLVALVLIALVLLVIVGKIRKEKRKKARAEAIRRRKLAEQQQASLKRRPAPRITVPDAEPEALGQNIPGRTRTIDPRMPHSPAATTGPNPTRAANPQPRAPRAGAPRPNGNRPVAGMPKKGGPRAGMPKRNG
ncbi:MAG: D-alanyl-D-alanine carboxypeptidase [Clostridia bacterium]|nr:D-alanyl-D-alanine carboxypeptidase [Clostridia bacterium]